MGIFDKLKNAANEIAGKKAETFTFSALPESVGEMKQLPEASLDTPFKAAALTVCALCAYAAEQSIGVEMLNFLKGPQPLSTPDIKFLDERFKGQQYLPFSYFAGAKPDNDYTPSEPFSVTVESNPHSFSQEGYATLYIASGGADTPRPVTLRKKDNQWFLWQQSLMVGIRSPKSQNPWG